MCVYIYIYMYINMYIFIYYIYYILYIYIYIYIYTYILTATMLWKFHANSVSSIKQQNAPLLWFFLKFSKATSNKFPAGNKALNQQHFAVLNLQLLDHTDYMLLPVNQQAWISWQTWNSFNEPRFVLFSYNVLITSFGRTMPWPVLLTYFWNSFYLLQLLGSSYQALQSILCYNRVLLQIRSAHTFQPLINISCIWHCFLVLSVGVISRNVCIVFCDSWF